MFSEGQRDLHVLLISPVSPFDPSNGDIRYTELLEAYPPPSVVYENYTDALQRGAIEELTGRTLVSRLRTLDLAGAGGAFVTAVSNEARRRDWMLPVQWRYFRVLDPTYDLVHLHYFSARLAGRHPPLVVSHANPLSSYLINVRDYTQEKLRAQVGVEVALARRFGINVNSLILPQASRAIAFTQFMRERLVRAGVSDSLVDVVPPYMPDLRKRNIQAQPTTIGFVAYDFEAKGGPLLLEAFARVREALPEASLTVVTAAHSHRPAEGVRWFAPMAYPRVVDIIRTFDVYALPSRFEGLMSILAAMSLGIPVVCSNYEALPEVLGQPPAGVILDAVDSDALTIALRRALDPDIHRGLAHQARARFAAAYSTDIGPELLGSAYRKALL